MALEIEAKIKVESHEPLRQRLVELRAERVGRVTELNQIFDTPQRRLFAAGCGLRVRTCQGDWRGPAATMTFKGPALTGTLKSRDEQETEVGDAVAAVAILQNLGFAPVLTFEKRREEWRIGRAKVELDELPRLGLFVEIEGPDESIVADVRRQLGLGDRPLVAGTYIALLIDHGRQNGLPTDRITFG